MYKKGFQLSQSVVVHFFVNDIGGGGLDKKVTKTDIGGERSNNVITRVTYFLNGQ